MACAPDDKPPAPADLDHYRPLVLEAAIAVADAIAAGRLGIAIGDWHTTGPGSPFATTAPRDPDPPPPPS